MTFAHCPLCTAATGAAVAVTRFYGVDDLIVGTFIGAFMISTAAWFDKALKRRNKGKEYAKFQYYMVVLATVLTTILSFYFGNLFVGKELFGINRLFLGSLIGTLITMAAFTFHDYLRRTNSDKNFVPFQAIFITFVLLIIINVAFYFGGLI